MDFYSLTAFCYFTSSIFYGSQFSSRNKTLPRIGFYTALAGVLIQTVSLITLYGRGELVSGGLDSTLYLFAWLIAIVYMASRIRFDTPILGAFVFPLAFIMTLPHVILPQGIIENEPSIQNPWVLIHIILILLGEALFTVAFIAGLLYIFQEQKISLNDVGSFIRKLPSLTTLDKINHLCLIVGFPFVTLGLALGLLLAKEIWGAGWHWGQKETWSIVTWFLYAVLIHGRISSGWKGRKAAIGAVLGFFIILITLFVIGFLAPGQHDFLAAGDGLTVLD